MKQIKYAACPINSISLKCFLTAVKSQSISFKNKYKKWDQCASLGENDHLLASD